MSVNRKTMGVKEKKRNKSQKKSKHSKKTKSPKIEKKFQKKPEKIAVQKQEEEHIESAPESSDAEEVYEKAPRLHNNLKIRNLLPVKNKKGLVYRSEVIPEEEIEEESVSEESASKVSKRNLVQNYAIQQHCLKNVKRKVALLCTSLIEEPENNMPALKELIVMFQNPSSQMIVSEKKILSLSLLHVFLDILPGYRIRTHEEVTTEKNVQLKKETKELLGYEQILLKCYKKYLDLLYDLVREMKSSVSASSLSVTKKRAAYEIGIVAVKCMCELLSTRFSFNHFKHIANKLVPLSIDGDENVMNFCCQAFQRLFRADKLGDASFDLVKQIINVIKQRKFCVPGDLLRSFLHLNLREAKVDVGKVDMGKGRKEWCMMSRTQRRDKKKIKELEAELKEAQAYESVENVKKFHTATLNKMFWVFFHILKDGEKVSLIAPALEGLSKFAYLINLEFFDDLNSVLCGMMESGQLSDIEKLHGVYTLFTILAGQAESLHIDPHKIYCHLYQGLMNLDYSTDLEHFELTLKCLEFNIVRKRKKISSNRILAFMKRIGVVSLQTPVHGTLGLLTSIRNILMNVKGSDILLDSESTVGSGIYLPEMEDPEHCSPQSTALWELHLLQKHYNPAVRLYAMHLLNSCPNHGRLNLPNKLSNLTPEGTLHLYADIAVKNKMDFLEDTEEPPKKKFKIGSLSSHLSAENSADLELDLEMLQDIDFLTTVEERG